MNAIPTRRAFVAAELLALVVVLAMLATFLIVGAGEGRRRARVAGSLTNLQQFAAGASSFAADNQERVYSFSWRAGEHHQDPDGFTYPPAATDNDAAAYQAVSIIRRRAGRSDLQVIFGWVPHILYNYLPLADYLGGPLPAEFVVSPSDHNRLAWQRAGRVPDNGTAFFALPNRPAGSGNTEKRWPYSGSYYMGPCFYSPDAAVNTPQGPVMTISQGSGHRFYLIGSGNTPMGRRTMSEVRYPANKAMLFEGYPDDQSGRRTFYFNNRVRLPVLFVDGAASVRSMSHANAGFDPNNPSSPLPSRFPYQPELSWEPPTLSGTASDFGDGKIQWTRSGLLGRDFGGPEVPWQPQ